MCAAQMQVLPQPVFMHYNNKKSIESMFHRGWKRFAMSMPAAALKAHKYKDTRPHRYVNGERAKRANSSVATWYRRYND